MPIVIVGAAALAGGLAWKFALGGPQTALLVAGGGAVILLLGLLQLNKARKAAAPKPAAMPEPVPSAPEEVPIPEGRLAFLKKPIGGSKEPKPKKENVKKEKVKKERVKRRRGRTTTEAPGAVAVEPAAAEPAPGQKAGRFAKMRSSLNKPIGGRGKEKAPDEASAPTPVPTAPAPTPAPPTPVATAPPPPTTVGTESPIADEAAPAAAAQLELPEQDRESAGAIVQELQETAARPKARRVCSYCWEPNDPARDVCFSCSQPLSLRAS